ncbi:hypothetical protein MUK42_28932, partial [Musa troglodytarum]
FASIYIVVNHARTPEGVKGEEVAMAAGIAGARALPNRSISSAPFSIAATLRACPFSSPSVRAFARLPRGRLPFGISRSPVELGCAQSLMPFHSVTATALLTSMLSTKPGGWTWLSEGNPFLLALLFCCSCLAVQVLQRLYDIRENSKQTPRCGLAGVLSLKKYVNMHFWTCIRNALYILPPGMAILICVVKVDQVLVICNLMTICYAEVDVEYEMHRVVSARDAERSNADGYILDKIPSDGMKRDSMLVDFNFCWIEKSCL